MTIPGLGISSSSLNCSRPIAWTTGSRLNWGRGSSACPFMSTSSTIALTSFFSTFMTCTSEVCHDQIDNGINLFGSEREPLLCEDRTNFVPALGHDICYPVGDLRLHLLKFEELVHEILGFLGRGLGKLIGMFHAPP